MEYTKKIEECGCRINQAYGDKPFISYCAKHKAAPDMYEALKETGEVYRALLGIIFAKGLTDLLKGMPAEFAGDANPLHKADKALAKAEGK